MMNFSRKTNKSQTTKTVKNVQIFSDSEIKAAIADEWIAFDNYEIACMTVDYIKSTIETYNIRDEESEINLFAAEAEEVATQKAYQSAKNLVDYMIYRNQIAALVA